MRIRWSGQANRDVNAIFDYLSERSLRGVRTVLSRVEKRVASLRENPLLGPAVFDTGARMLAVTRTDYVVYYQVVQQEIIVLRVLHGAQERRISPDA